VQNAAKMPRTKLECIYCDFAHDDLGEVVRHISSAHWAPYGGARHSMSELRRLIVMGYKAKKGVTP
jgi:hypothetical protein